jgi:hypothetical protein
MIREIELNLLVPSSELLVRLASGERPLGVNAGPPRIRLLRETYFDTPDQSLRRRGMTCKLRQGEGEDPSVVVTVGEGPDSEGITSRSRLTASAVGMGVFETLRGDSEPAAQVQKCVDPRELRPLIALDIQRLGRALRTRILRRPVLLLFFDRITVQAGRSSSVFHEIRIRRRSKGGPSIQDIARVLRDQYHLFPDGLSTLQRAHRILAMEGGSRDTELSPYALSLALALFREGRLGLVQRGDVLSIPTFRGSGEDAARALLSDLTGSDDLELLRLGTTDPREGRPLMEVWAAPAPPPEEGNGPSRRPLTWVPWHELFEGAGQGLLRDPNLLAALLLLTRRRLLGQMKWIPPHSPSHSLPRESLPGAGTLEGGERAEAEIAAIDRLHPHLRVAEDVGRPLEDRVAAVGEISRGLDELFLNEIREVKERILSEDAPAEGGPSPLNLLDLLSVKTRAMTDRLYEVVGRDILPALEKGRVHLRGWSGLMHEDRRALLETFSQRYLPGMKLVADWGPAFVPEMPPVGCALGLTTRTKGSESTRFFHLVLAADTPSFIRVPGSTVVLPLEEVIRGYLFSRYPALERSETHLFRFRTAEVMVREVIPNPLFQPEESEEEAGLPPQPPLAQSEAKAADGTAGGEEGLQTRPPVAPTPAPAPAPVPVPATLIRETWQSVVVRVVVHPSMPEGVQTRLLRALERQVSRKSPLIGWSDLYPVSGPMDLSGLSELLTLK